MIFLAEIKRYITLNCNNDFNLSLSILHHLTGSNSEGLPEQSFSDQYRNQNIFTTAIKILHKAALCGSKSEKEALLAERSNIVVLNNFLKTKSLPAIPEELEGMKIALPPTKFERMVEVASRVPRAIVSTLIDILLLPLAGILLLFMLTKPNFDPTEIKKGKIPILLLHGSGFNESEWILGRQFLKKENYGSVFSLNYDGLASNDPNMGIDDYAAGKVRDKILEIQQLTRQDQIILIGHSMGGKIGAYWAEYLAEQTGIQANHIITIGTPADGSPLLDRFIAKNPAKRYEQMKVKSEFREKLVGTARQSERQGLRKYYSIGSTTDLAAPAPLLTEDPRRQLSLSYLGHYGLIVSPRVWLQIRSWLDQIYR